MSFGLKSNGARMPVHKVEHVKRPAPGEARVEAPRRQGPKSLGLPERRAPVSLAEIPSLARDIALTHEDGLFMHAMRLAAEARLEGAAEARQALDMEPLTLEQEGALVRAFGLPRRADA